MKITIEENRTSHSREVSTALVNEINREWSSFQEDAHQMVELALVAENRKVRLGTLIQKAKDSVRHGAFGEFIRAHLPFTERTAQRLMRHAEAAGHREIENLDQLHDYHRLLIAWGLREAPEGHGQQALHPEPNYFISATKVLGSTRKALDELFEHRPLTDMSTDEREALRQQLEPVAQIYARLS